MGLLPPLIAPLRFSIIAYSTIPSTQINHPSAQSVYKGGFPRKRNIPFLRRLRLKTIISLIPKPLGSLDEEVSDWAQSANVTLIHVKCEKPKEDGGGLSKEAAAKALLVSLKALQVFLMANSHLAAASARYQTASCICTLSRWTKCQYSSHWSATQSSSMVK